ncbi:hypothetical protein SAMN06264364_101311 [Quadrisphaera granulorum]|uniref:Uncharacterized protein n=1 Tax=Quadrisphaera granulorum TaxID=317664 RepID=A0A316AEX1_9ACTN|nr:hypothetical protein [Quadrisphaera granulorum]PWJ56335.1 hypothetical protein BXY45_101311 [Quadrisphaera granulorum]SZE94969.1 hypothetical protein SAMN06264364_101311 [Quadrisphaera granulorum]
MDAENDRLDRPDRFEQDQRMGAYDARMLTALRELVAEQSSAEQSSAAPGGAHERARRRWTRNPLLVAAAAAAVVAGGLVVVPTLQAEPAWAVSRDAAGDVDVQVNRFDDAAGLERALEAEGIHADVTFLPDGTWCAPGRYDEDQDRTPSGTSVAIGEGHFGASVPAGGAPEGTTLVITASARSMTDAELRALDEDPGDNVFVDSATTSRVEFLVVAGPVAPCTAEPAPPLDAG